MSDTEVSVEKENKTGTPPILWVSLGYVIGATAATFIGVLLQIARLAA